MIRMALIMLYTVGLLIFMRLLYLHIRYDRPTDNTYTLGITLSVVTYLAFIGALILSYRIF